MKHNSLPFQCFSIRSGFLGLFILLLVMAAAQQGTAQGNAKSNPSKTSNVRPAKGAYLSRTITADVVALDQPYFYNRLGAQQPTGTVFALRSDVVTIDGTNNFTAGNVKLRDSKRPRPIVLRVNQGDNLVVKFTNLLTPYSPTDTFRLNYVDRDTTTISVNAVNDSFLIGYNPTRQALMSKTRTTGFHPAGLELVGSIESDGSWVGANANSLASPGGPIAPGSTKTYRFYAAEEGAFLISSGSDNLGPAGANDHNSTGLFGAVIVEPSGAEYYRSQVTNEDMAKATTGWVDANGKTVKAGEGLPIINWNAVYPANFWDAGRQNMPILNLLKYTGPNTYKIVNTDLTALITGPNQGNFPYNKSNPAPSYLPVPASPNREEPFREFVIIYHESPWTVQAFPISYDKNYTPVLISGDDAFSINYGSGGIGAEIYANRIGVGPMADCLECAYEEFFLSAWAVGDPAMVVDVPANTGTRNPIPPINPTDQPIVRNDVSQNVMASLVGQLETAIGTLPNPSTAPQELPYSYKATKALYPDDPSNVYHSYLRDHVKFRILHGGGLLTHAHHQHAHQWLHSPNSADGHYLDTQLINPGESYTLEMVYNGSGNRNQTVGDAIFHCHFYPHFAGGMWAMWRVHDVFETGTQYENTQTLKMATGARALPDAEITTGTPIPALVPMPTLAMAPVPGAVAIDKSGQVVVLDPTLNPGFPFFIPGVAGRRPPHPPLDFAIDTTFDSKGKVTSIDTLDGGLPRHVIVGGSIKWENHSLYDWTKIMGQAVAIQLPEGGTQVEKVAMNAHAIRLHPSITPKGKSANFIYNGLPPVQGAPFADPAVDDSGNAIGKKRMYKAADVQMDVVFNKDGWHYPQQRFITLWGDVNATLSGIRPPEPFFFRANTNEFIEYWHTNLIPEYYERDDYQVRTPTDILGQHIHLVKFDVTASDGAENGFNYEDGTFSPGTVRERIAAINANKGIFLYSPGNKGAINDTTKYQKNTNPLVAKAPNPIWGKPAHPHDWDGAQTTVQRWYADTLLNSQGKDQTLRTVFTHDHFGPSTHQQTGLYAGLLVEPEGSSWIDPINGQTMGLALPNGQPKPRMVTVDGVPNQPVSDGGPTSYQANIILKKEADSYREFAIEFQDIALAYTAKSKPVLNEYPWVPANAFLNKPFQDSVANYTGWKDSPNVINSKPTLNLITGSSQGTYSMNYRNEPLPLRLNTAGAPAPSSLNPNNDLAYVFQSRTDRLNPNFNNQPSGGHHIIADTNSAVFPKQRISAGMGPGDPYTPLLRAYQGDKIQIRTLVGAHLTSHFFNIHGIKWYFEPSDSSSGFRSTQAMGISEHFEMLFQLPTLVGKDTADYLYMPSADNVGILNGTWGILRAFDTNKKQDSLIALPYNNVAERGPRLPIVKTAGCPLDAPIVKDTIVAVMSVIALRNPPYNGKLLVNRREEIYINIVGSNALFLVRKGDLNADSTLKTNLPEPLVLRYNAGDCIHLTLENQFDPSILPGADNQQFTNSNPQYNYNWQGSLNVGLSPTLLSYDPTESDGFTVGNNPVQTVAPGKTGTYHWYAGQWERQPDGSAKATPVEFGSIVLQPADVLEHWLHGMEGAIIIEPQGATWREDVNSRASATVYNQGKLLFREFVLQFNDLTNQTSITLANYSTEPIPYRVIGKNNNNSWQLDLTQAFSNRLAGEPETPVFAVQKGTPTRIRLLSAQGASNGAVFELHGHLWQEEPYIANSTQLGYNPKSEWKGTQGQVGAFNAFDLLINKAGGTNAVPGDYLYSSLIGAETYKGFWGLMRVTDGADIPTVSSIVQNQNNSWTVNGVNTVNFDLSAAQSKPAIANIFAHAVEIYDAMGRQIASTSIDPFTGKWNFPNARLIVGNTYKLVSTYTSTYGKKTSYGTRMFTAERYGPQPKPVAARPSLMMLAKRQMKEPANARSIRFEEMATKRVQKNK